MARNPASAAQSAPPAPRGPLDRAKLPRFLNLFAIRFPIGAIASIGHRISGMGLLLALLCAPTVLEKSLRSEADYAALLAAWRSPWAAPVEFLIILAFSLHVLAGVRHLLMDAGIGNRLAFARGSARAVLVLALLAALAWVFVRRWT